MTKIQTGGKQKELFLKTFQHHDIIFFSNKKRGYVSYSSIYHTSEIFYMHTLCKTPIYDRKFSVKCFKCLWRRLLKHEVLNKLKCIFLDYLILCNLYLEHYLALCLAMFHASQILRQFPRYGIVSAVARQRWMLGLRSDEGCPHNQPSFA